jgi:hypothetical protein
MAGRNETRVLLEIGRKRAYTRTLGLRLPEPVTPEAWKAQRTAILAVLGQPSPATPEGAKGWPPHYAAARMAWHVLDHAWEMTDRSDPNS